MKIPSLVSLEKLCDDNFIVILDNYKRLAIKRDEIFLQGRRHSLDGLWDIPIQKAKLQADNYDFPKQHGFQYNQHSHNIIKETIYDKTNKQKYQILDLKVYTLYTEKRKQVFSIILWA